MSQLILVRHGQSAWNLENRFTGWVDVDLSEQGLAEAKRAGEQLLQAGIYPQACFTSVLKRAIRTLWIMLDTMDRMWLPVERSWKLNERHYGGLQGLNKKEMTAKVGEAQVHIWRRSFDIPPPELDAQQACAIAADPRYAGIDSGLIPRTESLKDTIARVLPYWDQTLVPALDASQTILVAAHGNSLRGLVKHLEGISDDAIPSLEIPTGVPIVYQLDDVYKVVDKRVFS